MKLGVMEYIVKKTDETETFLQARRLGFEGVEVELTREQLMACGRERLLRLKEGMARSGLLIPSLVLGEHNQGGIASPDPAVGQAAIQDIRHAIDWAAELQASVILVPFFSKGRIVTESDFEGTVKAFRELGPLALARGIRLCYEGGQPAPEILRLAEQIDSEAFGCYFDLANVVWRGMDTATEIRALGSLIQQVHIKDIRVGPGDCPPGLGRVDYAESTNALREVGYDGWIVLETPQAPAELVARDVSFTRFWFPQLNWGDAWPQVGAFSYDFKHNELENLIKCFKDDGLSAVQIGSEILQEALDDPATIPGMRTRLEENGIKVAALEGYVNNVLQNVGQVIGILERFPSKHLQLVLDPFNYLSSRLLPARERLVADFLSRFEHRFVLAHLKDVSTEGAEVATPEFGEGAFPHKLYLEFLRTRRPDLPIILEHLPLDHIPAAIQRIHLFLQL